MNDQQPILIEPKQGPSWARPNWPLSELDGLAGAIPYSKAGIVERQTLDLWNLPIVFLVLLALKLSEWLLRLRWGRL